mmetsp:Transcript_4944/g.11543  ORF Transcript_4944/g.11543 Transcript_4944/m.11543 type:complete len:258 (+) Transcript_4944:1323-2096(+)
MSTPTLQVARTKIARGIIVSVDLCTRGRSDCCAPRQGGQEDRPTDRQTTQLPSLVNHPTHTSICSQSVYAGRPLCWLMGCPVLSCSGVVLTIPPCSEPGLQCSLQSRRAARMACDVGPRTSRAGPKRNRSCYATSVRVCTLMQSPASLLHNTRANPSHAMPCHRQINYTQRNQAIKRMQSYHATGESVHSPPSLPGLDVDDVLLVVRTKRRGGLGGRLEGLLPSVHEAVDIGQHLYRVRGAEAGHGVPSLGRIEALA